MSLDPESIRRDFPAITQKISGRPVVFLDSACMTLKPNQVVAAMVEYYQKYPGCHNRASHRFGRITTEKCNDVREHIRKFFNARSSKEIIFVRNTTEAINILSHCLDLRQGDAVITSDLEHNSNLIPWMVLNKKKGVVHKIVHTREDLTFDLGAFRSAIDEKTKLVSIPHTTNISGTTAPVKEIAEIAHRFGALVAIDAAQSAPHRKVDVRQLDVDFMMVSFHKMLGPTGIGILYGKESLLSKMPQFLLGGETVLDVSYDSFVAADVPDKFEAGLQDYAGIIGTGAALSYLEELGFDDISENDRRLNALLTEEMKGTPGLKIIGPEDPAKRASIFNFYIDGMDSHEVARVLDEGNNIMVRSGTHCVHSWFNAHKVPHSVRASIYLYNDEQDILKFSKTLKDIIRYFK